MSKEKLAITLSADETVFAFFRTSSCLAVQISSVVADFGLLDHAASSVHLKTTESTKALILCFQIIGLDKCFKSSLVRSERKYVASLSTLVIPCTLPWSTTK